jgi:uncharacterized protein YcbX
MIVSKLFEYPVKGLLGNEICCATVNRRGLAMDRRWMLVDDQGDFLSQRQLPSLTQFQPEHQDYLTIKHLPSGDSKSIEAVDFTGLLKVVVWGQECEAHGAANGINQWLSDKLKSSVSLVYMDDNDIRQAESPSENDIVSFADAYPVLLTTEASFHDLNTRLDESIDINRFRPNIVIDGDLPFAEDNWQKVKIGNVVFKVIKRCARCHVINIDQQSGQATKEPLKTLSTYRKEGNKVNFGVNLIPETTGILHEADEVVVLS